MIEMHIISQLACIFKITYLIGNIEGKFKKKSFNLLFKLIKIEWRLYIHWESALEPPIILLKGCVKKLLATSIMKLPIQQMAFLTSLPSWYGFFPSLTSFKIRKVLPHKKFPKSIWALQHLKKVVSSFNIIF